MIANYIEKDCYFNPNAPDYFFLKNEYQIESLNISEHTFLREKKRLIDMGVIDVTRRGIPSKEYYKIDYKLLHEQTSRQVPPDKGPLVPPDPSRLAPPFQSRQNISSINTTHIKNKNKEENNKKILYVRSAPHEEEDNKEILIKRITLSQFDKFWALYPRAKEKGKTLTAWKKLCAKKDAPSWSQLKEAIKAQKQTVRWQTSKFIPLSTTWLNQSRWLDDPDDMNEEYDTSTSNNGVDAYKEKEIDPKFAPRRLREEDIDD